jgi:FkbM family methyltransferase
MFDFEGVWLPDNEVHLPQWMKRSGLHKRDGFPTYQYRKYEAALALCSTRRLAIDVGAHVGQWSRVMAMDFDTVVAFEPVARYRECWLANLKDFSNANLAPYALGDEVGNVGMETPTKGSHGDTRVVLRPGGPGAVSMLPLDRFAFTKVDFIKIDCEGFELMVLKGARETLIRNKPVLCVEQKPGHGRHFGIGDTDAIPFLKDLGFAVRHVISGDYIFEWDSATI